MSLPPESATMRAISSFRTSIRHRRCLRFAACRNAVISRFIVRMNRYITKQYYWKNGVFLHDGENRAKVKADLVDRKIFILVNGREQTRRSFLADTGMGFGKAGLETMELKDQFGQTTVIKFADLERNVKIAPASFTFTPPKGAAVISE